MIKKISIRFFLLLSITFSGFAQKNLSNLQPYKTSLPFKVFDFDNNFYVSKNQEILVLKFIRNHCVIQRFDNSLPGLIKENKYSNFFPDGFKLETFKEIEDKHYFFYSLQNKDKKCIEIYAQEIDFEKAEFINQPKLVLSTNNKVHKTKPSEYLHQNRINEDVIFDFLQNRDKSKLLIKYLNEVNSNYFLNAKLLDKTLTEIYSKSLAINKYDKKNTILSSQIDSKGDLFFISKKTPEEKNLLPNFFLNIVKVSSNEVTQKKINTNKHINDIWIREYNDEMLYYGFTSDFNTSRPTAFFGRTELNDTNGLICLKNNSEGEIVENLEFEFPDYIRKPFNKEKIKAFKEKESEKYIENLYLHDFEILENGDRILIGEQFATELLGGNNVTGIYGDIIICKFNKNSQLDFIKRLPKFQNSQNEMQPFSFKTFYSNNNIYLPFIDALQNLNPENPKIVQSGGDLILTKVSLINGDISRNFILNIGHKGEDLNKFSINRFYKSNLDSFCFDAYKKDKEDVIISVPF